MADNHNNPKGALPSGSKRTTPRGNGRAGADAERNAVLAEGVRRGNVARSQIAANKARVKSAARGHIGPLK